MGRWTNLLRLLAVLLTLGLIAAACGDDSSSESADEPAEEPADEPADEPAEEPADEPADEPAEEPADEPADEPAEEPADEPAAGADLAAVCPSPLIIQTDWFPESEHGAMYQLVGPDYTVDTDNQIISGSLIASGGVDTGIDIEVRAGGPAIGFTPGSARMYAEPAIHLAYVSTDQSIILGGDTPTISVVAPLEKNPQIIQWDPEVYPEIQSIADIGEAGLTVNVFAGGTFIDVFVNEGILSAEQIDPSYDGSPARYITEQGAIAQQGFASESPYSYEQVYEEWGKPIAFELIHDAGLQIYSQTLSIRSDDLDTLRPCLQEFVPIVQQAVVDFAADPSTANAIIIDAVEQIGSFWVYGEGLAQFSVDTQIELGLIGNGPDSTVGNMDPDRINDVIDKIVAAGFDVDPTLRFEDIATNEFIDESIGF